jgi:hypothetical protein
MLDISELSVMFAITEPAEIVDSFRRNQPTRVTHRFRAKGQPFAGVGLHFCETHYVFCLERGDDAFLSDDCKEGEAPIRGTQLRTDI